MKILFLGDVMGRAGRAAISEHLPRLRADWRLDFVVVNGENATNGVGLSGEHARAILAAGADCITLGDHAFDQKDMVQFIETEPRVLRPLNFAKAAPGRGHQLFTATGGRKVLVTQALGQVFMKRPFDDPFSAVEPVLKAHPPGGLAQAVIVDMHCEATSEKMAMGHFCDGRASLVVGTHTHVPTADAQVLPGGTGYLTDAGMCGDYNSVIGMDKAEPMRRFITGMPKARFSPALGDATLVGRLGRDRRSHRQGRAGDHGPGWGTVATGRAVTRGELVFLTGVLILLGAGWGITNPLSKIAVSTGYGHFGLVFWQLAIGTALMAGIALARGTALPWSAKSVQVYVIIALIGTVIPNSASYQAIAHLPSGVMSILLSLIPMIAFPIALGLRLERFSLRRFAGLLAGLAGVLLLVLPEASLPEAAMLAWIPMALVAPVLYAFEGNYVARWGIAGLDPIQVLFGASLIGTIIALPLALGSGQFISPLRALGRAGMGAGDRPLPCMCWSMQVMSGWSDGPDRSLRFRSATL